MKPSLKTETICSCETLMERVGSRTMALDLQMELC